jgi:virulence factor
MLETILKKYNHYRKEKFFQSPLYRTKKKYAFIGLGVHSLTNLYPLLRHFNIHLKYICTRSSDWSGQMSPLFTDCIFTHDINDILQDPSVAGVFVCASPASHYTLLASLLRAGKHVFIEKPPCSTLAELHELIRLNNGSICKIGLQRRYWPGTQYAQKKAAGAKSYIYQFQTGPYPQGDPFTELFIHPLDYAAFLFGPAQLQSFSKQQDDKGTTIQLHLTHPGPISGLLHLSTHYTWNPPLESLSVTTKNESLLIQYPASVTGKQMPFRVMNVPSERLMHQPATIKEYFCGVPSLVPAWETNTLYIQGFLSEIKRFVSLVEDPGIAKAGEASDLGSLVNIYNLMEKIQQP